MAPVQCRQQADGSRLGVILTNILAYDLESEGWGIANKSSTNEEVFLRETLPFRSVLKDSETIEFEASTGRDSGLRLPQTLQNG